MAWGLSSHAQGNQAESADLSGYTGGGGMPLSVNTSTGQLSGSIPLITIPGLDGEGYQMSLNYAPPTPGSEASWVGYGWSLSPGAIQRNQNGIADDFKGTIINISKKPDYTRMTGRILAGGEVFSGISGNIGAGSLWDSERGILPSISMSLSGYGAGISYLHEGSDGAWSYSINPVKAYLAIQAQASKGSGDQDPNAQSTEVIKKWEAKTFLKKSGKNVLKSLGKLVAPASPTMMSMPVYENGISGYSGGFVGTVQTSFLPNIGAEFGVDVQWTSLQYRAVESKEVTGYMRGGERHLGMDFMQERAGVLDEYDKFISNPVAMPDQYAVSAQGLSGTFRAHFTTPGTFHTDPIDYEVTQTPTLGLEFAAGASPPFGNVTGGGSVTAKLANELTSESWEVETLGRQDFGHYGRDVFFAFDGEPALQRAYASPDDVILARALEDPEDLTLSHSILGVDPSDRLVRTRWIRWNTNREANEGHLHSGKEVHPKRFCNQTLDAASSSFRSSLSQDHVGEFQIVNASGMTYTFGIPVMVRNRVDLSFNVNGGASTSDLIDFKVIETPAPRVGDFLDGAPIESVVADADFTRMSGRVIQTPIATSHLLTSITSPDYVDLTLDGPTEDDLGTWVKFVYDKDFGEGKADWFPFRSPFWGNHYAEGNLADVRDDMASFSAGEKEVYRLSQVETRTHLAIFYSSERTTDGRPVGDLDAAAEGVSLGSGATHRLDSISLFAKGSAGLDLLQVTRLAYAPLSESLVPGIQGTGSAALTLKGVTIQSADVAEEDNMAHYAFDYAYPTAAVLPEHLASRYGHLFTDHAAFSAAAQNPAFSFNASDAWGQYKLTPPSEFDAHNPWLDLRAWQPGSHDRDPAAHCLKQVTLPGGLSVFPQYEVGDYRHVQDDVACLMVPLLPGSTSSVFKLDLDAVDAYANGLTPHRIAFDLSRYYLRTRPLYYKVKYSLAYPGLQKHFTGFVPVQTVTHSGGDVFIHFEPDEKFALPHQVCAEYVGNHPKVSTGQADDAGVEAGEAGVQRFISEVAKAPSVTFLCSAFHAEESFVRIPLLRGMDKHGGPLRVKRLLMLDEGVGTEGALLTGTVYDYTEEDTEGRRVSSGVATNEPRSNYDEFGGYLPLPKREPEGICIFKQKDKETQTGPIGDAFLPGPAVIYGEVTTRQIHEGASTLGHAIHEFHTHREFPTEVTHSDKDKTRLEHVDWKLPFGVFNLYQQELWYAQGFQVEHSPMPGQPARIRSFGGHFEDAQSWYEVSQTEYEYFDPDDPLPLCSGWSPSTASVPQFDELYFHGRKVENRQWKGFAEFDLTIQMAGLFPIPIPSGWPSVSNMNQIQAVHGTTRLVQRPLFTKAITKKETGKVTRVEHLGFDPVTLQPVVVSTSDGFTGLSFDQDGDGTLDTTWTSRRIAYTLPAHERHPELGGMYLNDRKRLVSGEGEFEGMSIKKRVHNSFGHTLMICAEGQSCAPGLEGFCAPNNVMGLFSPGDLIRVTRKLDGTPATDENHYHVDRVSGNHVFLHPSAHLGHKGWMSDLEGDELDATVEVLRSGRKNQLTLTSGSVEVYSEALEIHVSQRLGSELDAFIARMNDARPALPTGMTKTKGESNLLGVSSFSDETQFQEGGCEKVADRCALESFSVDFHPQCGVGYVQYPSANTGLWTYDATSLQPPDGPIYDYIQWGSDICSSDTAIIPIRYNPMEDGGGRFEFDHDLGAIVWRTCDNPCNPVVIFTPCRDWSRKIEVDDVIASSETVFRDDLEYEFLPTGGDPYETGARGRWVQHSSWVAQSEASTLDDADVHHSRQAGILDRYEALNEDFADYMVTPFVEADLHPWIRTSRSTLFDRRGHTLETLDALGHYTSMEMGAQEKLVTWTVQGARNGACLFESFERREGGLIGTLSDSRLQVPAPMWSDERGHTGRRSLKLNVVNGASGQTRLGQVALDERSLESDGGVEVRFWVHNPKDASTGLRKFYLDSLFTVHLQEVTDSPEDGTTPTSGGLTLTGTVFEAAVDSLVQTGSWTMMEARLPGSQLAGIPLDTRMLVSLHWEGPGAGNVYLDDLRIRPFNTSMACTVHDGDDFKVLAELDDDHFARKYQYNRLNQQVRTQIETAGGWKTVSESVQHTKPEGP